MQELAVFHPDKLWDFIGAQMYGVSIYKGVTVVWDEDMDGRVLTVIDLMEEDDLKRLVAICEHEGQLRMAWGDVVPSHYLEGGEVEVPMGRESDVWIIDESVAVPLQEIAGCSSDW